MRTSVLDFTGCVEEEDFFDRIIDALDLGVGYCGRSWSGIYDFGSTSVSVQKLEIKGSSSLKGYLGGLYFKDLLRTLERIKGFHESRGRVFEYEIID